MSTNPDVVIQQVFDQIEKLGDRQIEQTEKLANIQGFLSAITSMQNDIVSNRASISGLDRRVTALEQESAVVRSYLKGIVVSFGVFWVGVTTFALPWIKDKFGL